MTHFRQGRRSGLTAARAIAFFARHELRPDLRPFEISLPAAARIVPLTSRGLAGVAGIPTPDGAPSFRRASNRTGVIRLVPGAGKIFHAVAVRQRFSTFSMSRVLRRIGIGIIV